MSLSGINALLSVSQQKADSANQDALKRAEQQRQIVEQASPLDHLLSSSSAIDRLVAPNVGKAVPPDPIRDPATVEAASQSTRGYSNLGNLADGDIMAVAFIVMMEATKSAQEDLKSIMDGVKLVNEGKSRLDETVSDWPPHGSRHDP